MYITRKEQVTVFVKKFREELRLRNFPVKLSRINQALSEALGFGTHDNHVYVINPGKTYSFDFNKQIEFLKSLSNRHQYDLTTLSEILRDTLIKISFDNDIDSKDKFDITKNDAESVSKFSDIAYHYDSPLYGDITFSSDNMVMTPDLQQELDSFMADEFDISDFINNSKIDAELDIWEKRTRIFFNAVCGDKLILPAPLLLWLCKPMSWFRYTLANISALNDPQRHAKIINLIMTTPGMRDDLIATPDSVNMTVKDQFGVLIMSVYHEVISSAKYKYPAIVPTLFPHRSPKIERSPLTINYECIVSEADINEVFSFTDLKHSEAIYKLQKHHGKTLREILLSLTHDSPRYFMHTYTRRNMTCYRLHILGQDFNEELENAYQQDELLDITFHSDQHQLMDALIKVIDCNLAAELTNSVHTPATFQQMLMDGFEYKLSMYSPMAQRYLNSQPL